MTSASANLTIDTDDGPMPAYEASTKGEPRGGIVVIQEAFGVTSHIEDVARRLADAGWHAVAPSLFHRQGSPVFDYDDLASVMPAMQQLTAAHVETDVTAAFDYLDSIGFGPSRTGIVGFCMGGTVTFVAATLRPVGAAVTFYGGGVRQGRFGLPGLIDLAPSLQTPWLGLFGDLDKSIPVEDVEALRAATAAVAIDTEIVRYPDADHGFHCNDRPAVFNPHAAADAWHRTLTWFDDHLAG
ncbi:MAG TPA: dienelactone hydrolase family protein [Acidimicrobiales bacterium]|nr:dienelactone hydrolase family protein [Acidimicrobiales bacterium]